MSKQITSWSFSRYSDYKLCPLKAKFKHVDKLKEPGSPAMERGAMIHNLAEDYIKGKIKSLPVDLKAFEAEFKALRKQYKKKDHGMVVEDNWAFTSEWSETRWDDWVGCWVRIKLDCAHHVDDTTLVVTDWKTGKFRPETNADYIEQLELYALAAFLLYPHIQIVKPRLVYLDVPLIYPPEESSELIYHRSSLPVLLKLWTKRVEPMLKDKKFAPKPNNKCQWCHFRRSNGGPCKF